MNARTCRGPARGTSSAAVGLRLFLLSALLLVPACKGSSSGPAPSGGTPSPVVSTPSAFDVLTYHNDTLRTGQYLSEVTLTPGSVSALTFGKLFTLPVDGQVFAQPLYKYQVNLPGLGTRNVVYAVTMHDSVYAFDADANTGSSAAPLWQVSFINPPSVTSVPLVDYPNYTDLRNEIGILSTPVIDASSNTLYLVAKTKETAAFTATNTLGHVYRLHALDLATGAEKFGGPVVLGGSVLGTGDASVGGVITFDPIIQNQRSALLLAGGQIFIPFSSYGDNGPYHGWILAYDAQSLTQTAVWNDTPNNPAGSPGQGGIWMDSSGPAWDGTNLYFSTGNGWFDTTAPVTDFGDTVVKLGLQGGAPGVARYLAPIDYFTPSNQASLNLNDLDLDSGGIMLLPTQPGTVPNLLVASGKDGSVYLVDRDNMGRFNAGSDQIVQESLNFFPGTTASPAFWNNTIYYKGSTVDISISNPKPLYSFSLVLGTATTPTTINFAPSSQTAALWGWPGSTPSISANNLSGGIVWVLEMPFTFVGGVPVSTAAILRAYDATNLAIELYDSTQTPGDALGKAIKFTLPTVANGKVYVGADAVSPTPAAPSELSVFGLKP